MSRWCATMVAAGVLVGAVPAASAQSDDDHALGSRLTPRQDIASSQRSKLYAIRQGHAMASCQVHKRTDIARQFLDATDAATVQTRNNQLSRELTCIGLSGVPDLADGIRVSYSTDIYRGNLAEALIDRVTPLPALDAMPLQKVYESPFAAVSGRNPAVDEMAVCVAQTAPGAIVAVLATAPESAPEMSAIQAALPAIKLCLAASAKLSANRESMRAALAEALYHRVAGRTVFAR